MPEANSNRSTTSARSTFNPYRERALRAREIRTRLAANTNCDVDPFAHVNDGDGFVGAMPRPSAMLRADRGVR